MKFKHIIVIVQPTVVYVSPAIYLLSRCTYWALTYDIHGRHACFWGVTGKRMLLVQWVSDASCQGQYLRKGRWKPLHTP